MTFFDIKYENDVVNHEYKKTSHFFTVPYLKMYYDVLK